MIHEKYYFSDNTFHVLFAVLGWCHLMECWAAFGNRKHPNIIDMVEHLYLLPFIECVIIKYLLKIDLCNIAKNTNKIKNKNTNRKKGASSDSTFAILKLITKAIRQRT